jgi:DNA modification methylase
MQNQIIHGEAFEELRKLETASVDLVITDPPYKVSQKYGGGTDADNLSGVASILRTLPEISRVLKPDRFCVVCYDNRIFPFLFEAVKGTRLVYRKSVFLYRRWGIANRWVGWMQTTDPICIFVNGYDKPFAPAIQHQVKHDCYIKASPEEESTGHPAQKPLELMEDFVLWLSNVGDVVLDPYCGSGTSLVAASKHARNWIGIEREPSIVEMARARIRAAENAEAGSTSANTGSMPCQQQSLDF